MRHQDPVLHVPGVERLPLTGHPAAEQAILADGKPEVTVDLGFDGGTVPVSITTGDMALLNEYEQAFRTARERLALWFDREPLRGLLGT